MQNLKEINQSKDFYDNRYTKGYMESWPEDKKQKVFEIIKKLKLPEKGEALDFGCGNGIFTEILKECLPSWTIYGCDLSSIAINNAKNRIRNCTFLINDDLYKKNQKFDFIFSHHVLEHVFNIEEVTKQITNLTKEKSFMLHILPCGNQNSFEWKICGLRKNGIDENNEDRFFYEDPGHVRRMTTESCVNIFNKYNFILNKEYYANQYQGSINWITRINPLIMFNIFNPFKGKDLLSGIKLSILFIAISLISCFRMPYIIYKKFNNKIIKILFFIPSMFSKYIDTYMINSSNKEWTKFKENKNGSEMFLFLKKK